MRVLPGVAAVFLLCCPTPNTADGGAGSDGGSVGDGTDLEWSQWPAPAASPPASAYAITPDTVTDSVTSLTWQRNHAAMTYSWADAVAYCEDLTLAGSSDWRLPTVIELESIADYGRFSPSIDLVIFPGTPGFQFWSASRNAAFDSYAWVVHFSQGNTQTWPANTPYNVRCVQGRAPTGPAGPGTRYTISAETVRDAKTMLTWQRTALTTTHTWPDAVAYCQALDLGGLTGWRIPTLKELHSLVNIRAANPALDGAAFPGMQPGYCWSATPYPRVTDFVWTLNLAKGDTFAYGTLDPHPVRCVR